MNKCDGCAAYKLVVNDENNEPLQPESCYKGCIARLENECDGTEKHEVSFTVPGTILFNTDKETAGMLLDYFSNDDLVDYFYGFPELGTIENL